MRPAFHLCDDRSDLIFGQVDHSNPGARSAKGERHFPSDAAGRAGDEDALTLQA
jgi:hypothetical protein